MNQINGNMFLSIPGLFKYVQYNFTYKIVHEVEKSLRREWDPVDLGVRSIRK